MYPLTSARRPAAGPGNGLAVRRCRPKIASGGLGFFCAPRCRQDPRQDCLWRLETSSGCLHSVMDTLDYGISSPQLAMMNNGSVFVAGQYEPPMTPPVQSQNQTEFEPESKIRPMDAGIPSTITAGSALLGSIYVHKAITITAHFVSETANRHSAVRITPTNQSKWIKDPVNGWLFNINPVDIGGYHYITLSAGPEYAVPIPGVPNHLWSFMNKSTDVGNQNGNLDASDLATTTQDEDGLILLLINNFKNYLDSYLYTLIPSGPGQYNSNSFTHGLLNASGLGNRVVNSNVDFPGWENPLPNSAFGQ